MVDSVQVWPPGFRVTDANDDAVSGAYIEFFDAGTSDARTVYSDNTLSTSLGTTVYCDTAGAPVSAQGGSTKVHVYTDDTDYKTIIKDSDGNTLETKDNIKGAVDLSSVTSTEATPVRPVVSKSANYTILSTDQGDVVNFDPTSGDLIATLPSAVTVGDDWLVTIRHVGSANKVTVNTVSSQTVDIPLSGGAATTFDLLSFSEGVTLVSDGANWHCIGQVMGLKLGVGYHHELYDIGTVSSGTETPEPENGQMQTLTNGGAFTLAPTSKNCSFVVHITNNASAGTITTSGFDIVAGDSLGTGNGDKFLAFITIVNGDSVLTIEALQ